MKARAASDAYGAPGPFMQEEMHLPFIFACFQPYVSKHRPFVMDFMEFHE